MSARPSLRHVTTVVLNDERRRQNLYVVVFGGAQSLFGTIASAFSIAQTQATSEFFLTGSMAKVLTLSLVILILMARPQGLFALKVRR